MSSVVLLLGLAVTAIVALLQQSNVKNTRQLTFDAAAAHVQEELVDAVDTELQSFESGLNFISATHPGPLDQYQAYFSNRGYERADDDPGFVLIERVPPEDTTELALRERALGNRNFSPLLLPSDGSDRLIVTRTAYDTKLLGLPVIGLDVAALQGNDLIDTITSGDGTSMFVLRSNDIVGLVASHTSDVGDVGYEDFTAFIAAEVSDQDGALIGYSIQSQQIGRLLSSVTYSDLKDLSVELYVADVENSIDGRLSPGAPDIEDAGLRASREVTTASLQWRIDVWADDDFGPATGLFDQVWIWMIGVLTTVAAYAASVRRQRNRRRLDIAHFELAHARTLAMTDALTGLLNRNGLVEAARQIRGDTPATVFFIDLDGFKAVNDTGGHELGDQVLRSVATRLSSIFRTEDLVSRLGGDEFVVFTGQESGAEYVAAVSERITRSISDIDDRVTCSLGVASRTAEESIDIKDLVRAADTAMYEAKRSGGDRFSVSHLGPK